MYGDTLNHAAIWLDEGRQVALATVIAVTRAPGPLEAGAQIAVDGSGALSGYFVGEFHEGEPPDLECSARRQCLAALGDGEPRLLRWQNATIDLELYVEPVEEAVFRRELLDRLLSARSAGHPIALVTDLIMGLKTLVYPDTVHGRFRPDDPDLTESRRLLTVGRCAVLEPSEDTRLFVHVFPAPVTK